MSNHVQGFSPGLVHLGSVSLHFWGQHQIFQESMLALEICNVCDAQAFFVFFGGFVYLSPPSLHFPSHYEMCLSASCKMG